jgi:hypothetical protein
LPYAAESPATMARALHSTLTSTATKSLKGGLKAVRSLVEQLSEAAQRDEPLLQALSLPRYLQGNRAAQIALRSARLALIEFVFKSQTESELAPIGLQRKYLETYVCEICDNQFLGILREQALDPYFQGDQGVADRYIRDVKEALPVETAPTVEALLESLEDPKVAFVPMPRREKRDELEVMSDEVFLKVELN